MLSEPKNTKIIHKRTKSSLATTGKRIDNFLNLSQNKVRISKFNPIHESLKPSLSSEKTEPIIEETSPSKRRVQRINNYLNQSIHQRASNFLKNTKEKEIKTPIKR